MADDTKPQDHPLVTLSQARTFGLARYRTSKPCKRGHIAERRTSTRVCVVCSELASAELAKKDPEGSARRSREWRAANPEAAREQGRIRRITYAAEEAARQRAWRKAKPEAANAIERNRHARKRVAGGSHTAADILELEQKQKGRCAHPWCRKSIKAKRHVDHIKPIVLGGSNDRKNLQLLCVSCNLRKSATHPVDFALRNGMLV
jgi:5-methylcytosine-specific restriction endonuclease McrA